MSLEEQVGELEKDIEQLKSKKKDKWDIIQILGGLLLPFAIAFVGWQYSKSMKDQELKQASTMANLQLQFSKQKEVFDQQVSELNSKVNQAKLVALFLKNLLAKDKKEQKLAIESILIGLPVEGPRLVEVIQSTDVEDDIKLFAEQRLENFQSPENTIVRFFSSDKEVRKNAYDRLKEQYTSDQTLIPKLIETSRKHTENLDATYNLLVFLSHIDSSAIKPYINKIYTYAIEVEGNGPKTKERVWKLIDRFPCNGKQIKILENNIVEIPNYINIDNGELKLFPRQISPNDSEISIVDPTTGRSIRDLTLAIGESGYFMYNDKKYTLVLNGVLKQFFTGDLRANFDMSKEACK